MKKVLSIFAVLGATSIFASVCAQDLSMEAPDVEMRHHHHHKCRDKCHDRSCHHSRRGPTGATGPTGSPGITGAAGVSGGLITPSFGYFYSTTGQTVPPAGAIYFGITGAGPVGTAFSFDPGTNLTGSSIIIGKTGYYAINYGFFVDEYTGTSLGVALTLNSPTNPIPNSIYYPLDAPSGDAFLPAFGGIFLVSATGTMELTNISLEIFSIESPQTYYGGLNPVTTSAYINIQYLSPE